MLTATLGSFARRRTVAALLTAAMLAALAVVVVGAAIALNGRTALGAGGGGGGCFLNSGPVCTVKGQTANADFQTVSPDGCILTDAFVSPFQGLVRPGAGSGTTVFVDEYQFNMCTNTPISSVSNIDPSTFNPSFTGTVQFSKTLGSASVVGTAQMFDETGAPAFVASINVTWQSFGPPTTTIDNSHFISPGFKLNTRFIGTTLQALASGVITDGTGANLAAAPSPNASLQSISNGTVVISH